MCAKSTTYPKKKCHLRLEPEAKSAHKEERRQGQLSRERVVPKISQKWWLLFMASLYHPKFW